MIKFKENANFINVKSNLQSAWHQNFKKKKNQLNISITLQTNSTFYKK